MLELLQRLKPASHDTHIADDIAKLASREREVRTLEMLIEYISTLDDEDLAQAWPRLIRAIYASPQQCDPRGLVRASPPTTQPSMPHPDYSAGS